MLNPNDFDEVCVQAIHVDSGGRPLKFTPKTFKHMETEDSKKKGKSKGKKTATAQKEDKIPTCTNCQRIGHDEARCWKLHLELKPKKFQMKKGEKKAETTIQQRLDL